jgi:hypothetical protein
MALSSYTQARLVDSDVSALAAEIFYTRVGAGECSVHDNEAAYDALIEAQYSHADLLRFADEWDAQIAAERGTQ